MDYAGIFIMNRDKLNHIGISLLMIGLRRALVKKVLTQDNGEINRGLPHFIFDFYSGVDQNDAGIAEKMGV